MLQEIIELQQTAVASLVAELKKDKKEITFKAPTGSGKTYMMADLMNRMLVEDENIVFLVSSLSIGNLARQNYEKFEEYKEKSFFPCLNPYLINSDIAGEERLFISTEYNVYLLPRDLYKKGGRLMQGSMLAFLNEITFMQRKRIIVIKDECHIATNNLDDLASEFFHKTINFSATPKLVRGQHPDVEIKNEDAENAKLIKTIEWGAETDKITDAVKKFEEIKKDYRDLGVNPCLIIQISNKEKADEELKNEIMPALNANPELKWMLIVDKDKDCDTNDVFKAKKLPVAKWKDYAKQKNALIDVIIFKMVITEGWDIPRACMLYQVRNTQSKQLDEQVIGRVRRNPRLLDFETLNEKAQQLAMTAWVWGIFPEEQKKVHSVKLYDETTDITDNIKVKITKLKKLTEKEDFNISTFLAKQTKPTVSTSIFDLSRQLRQADNEVKNIVYDYATDFSKWREIAEFIPEIEKENNKYRCDYVESMELAENEVSFAISSHYTETEKYERIGNWVWKHRVNTDKFWFDSEAESNWADILEKLSRDAFMPVSVGKIKKKSEKIGQLNLFGETEMDIRADEKEIFLWGKNFVANSAIKFEYYIGALHSSFPDFVMKDKFGRVHIFEVKSVNLSKNFNFDNNIYKSKIEELKKCYKRASVLTEQIFYLPVIDEDIWQITRFYKGEENTLSINEFRRFVKTN